MDTAPTAAPCPPPARDIAAIGGVHRDLRAVANAGQPWSTVLLCAALGLALALGAATSCSRSHSSATAAPSTRPDMRLLFVSGLAGALEPCGCRKDMLGGVDHAASWLAQARTGAQASLLLGAGPMLFMNPQLSPERRTQDLWKAEALAQSLRAMDLRAWAPGHNDYAAGPGTLEELLSQSGARLLGDPARAASEDNAGNVYVLGTKPLRVGVVGVGVSPAEAAGARPPTGGEALQSTALREGLAKLRKEGVPLRVALVAAQRGQALRLAEQVPGFHVLAIGNERERGESNEAATPPTYVGETLVVQPPNHLQGIAQVDVYVREGKYEFADGSALRHTERLESLRSRTSALAKRLATWKKKAPRSPAELKQRFAALEELKKQLGQAETQASALRVSPGTQSALYYKLTDIVEEHGQAPAVAQVIDRYYRRVNEHNRVAFKDRRPDPVPAGQAGYSGIETCGSCHQAALQFWTTTRHAAAYATLADDHKQFNLDCVGCHVTGYGKPGGTTVAHVEKLMNVQCEACHGPGSLHVARPSDKSRIQRWVEPATCRGCHHEPHVAGDWNVARALPKILGPGHGQPLPAGPAAGK